MFRPYICLSILVISFVSPISSFLLKNSITALRCLANSASQNVDVFFVLKKFDILAPKEMITSRDKEDISSIKRRILVRSGEGAMAAILWRVLTFDETEELNPRISIQALLSRSPIPGSIDNPLILLAPQYHELSIFKTKYKRPNINDQLLDLIEKNATEWRNGSYSLVTLRSVI